MRGIERAKQYLENDRAFVVKRKTWSCKNRTGISRDKTILQDEILSES